MAAAVPPFEGLAVMLCCFPCVSVVAAQCLGTWVAQQLSPTGPVPPDPGFWSAFIIDAVSPAQIVLLQEPEFRAGFLFDVAANAFSAITTNGSFPPARADVSHGAAGGSVFVMGGYQVPGMPFDTLGGLFEYQFASNMWASGFSGSPSRRMAMSTAVNSGNTRLYGFGGQDPSVSIWLQDVGYADVSTRSWTTLSVSGGTPPSPRGGAAMGVNSNEELVVFGGEGPGPTRFNDVHVYAVASRQWSAVGPGSGTLPTPRIVNGIFFAAANVLVIPFGYVPGVLPSGNARDAFAWDMRTNTWHHIADESSRVDGPAVGPVLAPGAGGVPAMLQMSTPSLPRLYMANCTGNATAMGTTTALTSTTAIGTTAIDTTGTTSTPTTSTAGGFVSSGTARSLAPVAVASAIASVLF
jgi:Galactose oxidase, central domain